MVIVRYKQTHIFEIDTDTGKSRTLQNFMTPLGEDVKLKKPKPKKKVVQNLVPTKTQEVML